MDSMMSNDAPSTPYNENFTVALQWMWGDGYLAPGGPEEVAELLKPVSLVGQKVLDIGSGLGAIDVLLAEKYGAKEVVGIDVESHLIDHSKSRAERVGLSDRVTFELVEPGPLPFPDASFDVVFSKDAIVHIPDKAAMYVEVLRVLRPGGFFVGSDWLRGDESTYGEAAKNWLNVVHLNFELQDLAHTQSAIERAGFERVLMNDRNAWYQDVVREELATLSGEKLEGLASRIGADQAAYRLESSRLKQQAIEHGFLRPTHFVGYKPA